MTNVQKLWYFIHLSALFLNKLLSPNAHNTFFRFCSTDIFRYIVEARKTTDCVPYKTANNNNGKQIPNRKWFGPQIKNPGTKQPLPLPFFNQKLQKPNLT
jgi:hypothetical protein